MGKQTVPVAVQATPDECSLQPQEKPRATQEGEAQGARDVDTWSDVARGAYGYRRAKDSREGDGDGDGQGEDGCRVRGYPDVSQVQVEEDILLPVADSECR